MRPRGSGEIFQAYTERKRHQHVLDYDDLLLFWKAMATSTATAPQLAAMFEHILVDEYQDTNALQADILEGMRPAAGPQNLTVVGDDAQAIYGFRAATVKNILEFPERFPGAAVVKLERNYRSTPPILAASNEVIALSPQRHEKTLRPTRPGEVRPILRACLDEAEQSDAVCRAVLAASGGRCSAQGAGRPVPGGATTRTTSRWSSPAGTSRSSSTGG